ncbi:MAG: hypothetical protein IJG51_08305 [Synergistaceae bacterium]|nr:hypothetical protein [Synergistaceae bacterium]MBQ3347242.1 hypothetical protein [Synergistaceae bacterium]MBQ3398876.1 hypothetical protein [Synergistaceae bacterium]MBQ3758647.1 hypothetical protein [Synergistaceae bacterium]MBQ4402061.1 hypothetical protein [Synergistaceae bacterium]
MKRKFCVMSLSVLLLAMVMTGTAGAFSLNFTLYNNSGWNFKKIWLSPAGNRKWNPARDVVKNGSRTSTLSNGHNMHITFDNVSQERRNVDTWDLRVDTSDGKKHEFHNIPLSQIMGVDIGRGWEIGYVWPGDI